MLVEDLDFVCGWLPYWVGAVMLACGIPYLKKEEKKKIGVVSLGSDLIAI